MRAVDARDAFVVGGKSYRDAELAIKRKRMIFTADAENEVIAGQADFDHDVIARHFFQQFVRIVFVHDIHAVADAFGLRFFDRKANVTAEAFVGNEPWRQFASVQSEMNSWVELAEKSD